MASITRRATSSNFGLLYRKRQPALRVELEYGLPITSMPLASARSYCARTSSMAVSGPYPAQSSRMFACTRATASDV